MASVPDCISKWFLRTLSQNFHNIFADLFNIFPRESRFQIVETCNMFDAFDTSKSYKRVWYGNLLNKLNCFGISVSVRLFLYFSVKNLSDLKLLLSVLSVIKF